MSPGPEPLACGAGGLSCVQCPSSSEIVCAGFDGRCALPRLAGVPVAGLQTGGGAGMGGRSSRWWQGGDRWRRNDRWWSCSWRGPAMAAGLRLAAVLRPGGGTATGGGTGDRRRYQTGGVLRPEAGATTGGGAATGGGAQESMAEPVTLGCGSVPVNGRCSSSTTVEYCSIPTGNGTPTVVSITCGLASRAKQPRACINAYPLVRAEMVRRDVLVHRRSKLVRAEPGSPVRVRSDASTIPVSDFCAPNIATQSVSGTLLYEFRAPNSQTAPTGFSSTITPLSAAGCWFCRCKAQQQSTRRRLAQMARTPFGFHHLPQSGDRILFIAAATDGLGMHLCSCRPATRPGISVRLQLSFRPPKARSWQIASTTLWHNHHDH